MSNKDCYCSSLPKGVTDGQVQLLARCNACWNELLKEKHRLIAENNNLRSQLNLPHVDLVDRSKQ